MASKIRPPLGRRELVAVFDESGKSSAPGPTADEDFALASVVFEGPRAWRNLASLDERLRQLTGQNDYKYRAVRQITEARSAVVETLNHQSGIIRVFGYYAAGGAFLEQAKRELQAAQAFGEDVKPAEEKLRRLVADPHAEGLSDAMNTSIPAMSAWAGARQQRVRVHFDRRNNLEAVADDVLEHMSIISLVKIWGDSYDWMDWQGDCPPELDAVARVADVFVGDIRATFKKHGGAIWQLVKPHGFVRRHEEVAADLPP